MSSSWWSTGEEKVLAFSKPSAFSNDWIIELLRRTQHHELQQIASRHWHRQIHVKHRSLAPASPSSSEEDNPLLSSLLATSDLIHPYIDQLRNEKIAPCHFPTPCVALSAHTRLDESPATEGRQQKLSLTSFVAEGGLPWLANLLLGPYRRSAWEPLLCILVEGLVIRLNQSGDYSEEIISIMEKKHPDHSANVLELLLDQVDLLPSCSVTLTMRLGQLWNFLVRFHDISWIQKLIQKYLCEVLLRRLVTRVRSTKKEPSEEAKLQMHGTLKKLMDVYHTPQRVFTTSSATKEKLFSETFLSTSLRWLQKYENLVSFSPPSSPRSPSDDPSSSVTWSGDEFEACLFSILDLFVTVTSQSVTGRYLSWLLCFWHPKEVTNASPFYYIHAIHRSLHSFPLSVRRRLEATLCTLELNCVEFLQVKEEWEEKATPVVKISIDDRQYHRLLGVETALPDAQYLLDCANQNLYVPQMSLRYLSMKDYLLRNFALAKLNLSTSLWQSFTRSYEENMRAVSVSPSGRSCHAHTGMHVTVEVDQLSHLQYSDSSKKTKSFDNSPAPIVFLLSWSEEKQIVHEFIPAHYCHHSLMKGNRVAATLCLPPGSWVIDTLTHVYVGNPALIASCRVHEVLHGLIQKCATPASRGTTQVHRGVIFPLWFEEMISGKLSSTKLEQARQVFPQSHDWMTAPGVHFQFMGLIEESLFRDFLSRQRNRSSKTKGSHLSSLVCDECSLSCVDNESEDERHSRADLFVQFDCPHVDRRAPLRVSQEGVPQGVPVRFSEDSHSSTLKLYPTQQEAILSSLFHRFTIIIGPPGTGKTCVTTQLIRLLYHNFYLNTPRASRKKILMLAHSNNAVDQLIERVDTYHVPILRLGGQTNSELAQQRTYDGHIAQMQKEVVLIVNSVLQDIAVPGGRLFNLLEEIRNVLELPLDDDIEALEMQLSPSSCRDAYSLANSIYQRIAVVTNPSMRRSGAETRDDVIDWLQVMIEALEPSEYDSSFTRLEKIVDTLCASLQTLSLPSWEKRRSAIFDSSAVVAATCSGLAFQTNLVGAFDTIIIEEAGKVLELECLYAFSEHCKRVVLVGDDQQMRSLVHDKRLKVHSELDQPLLARMQRLGMQSVQLDQQTRARSQIADLYRWRYVNLQDHARVHDISPVLSHTEGAYYCRISSSTKRVKGFPEANAEECAAILSFARTLADAGVKEDAITLLSPYKQQKSYLQQECNKAGLFFATHTVDEYQGKENEIVLLSMAFSGRSPSAFLCDERRVNVMTSRAQRLFVLFGNINNLQSVPAWEELLSKMTELSI